MKEMCKSIKREWINFYIGYYKHSCSLKETPSVSRFEVGCVVIVVVCTVSLSIHSWNNRWSAIYIVARKIDVTSVSLYGLIVPDCDERTVITHSARVKEAEDVRLLSRLHYDVCPLSPVAEGLH
jgi:hypothetical protein